MRIRRVVTTRAGGRSAPPFDSFNLGDHVGDDPAAVLANRERLAEGLGLTADRIVWLEQVHGRSVAIVDGPQAEPLEATDGVVTATPGLALAVLVADCVPVLLGDPVSGVVGAAHAGRVGTRIGIIPATVEAMVKAGAVAEQIEVLLGPAVCGECYEVPAAMQADVDAHVPGTACKTRNGKPGLDLRAGIWGQLAEAGVGKIGIDPRCTAEDRTLFSYRREGTTGRLAGVVWIGSDE